MIFSLLHLDFFNQIKLSDTINNNIFDAVYCCKAIRTYPQRLRLSVVLITLGLGKSSRATEAFIESPGKVGNYFSGRGSSSSAPVLFSPVFYAVEILFSLKHFWNMSVQNICESWDADYAAPLHNSFCYLGLAIAEVAGQHVSISKKCFPGHIVSREKGNPKKD